MEGKVAIVTGASREIGAAIAERLARDGMSVLLSHFGEPERAEANAGRIRAAGGRVEVFGRLDIMAANAGITITRSAGRCGLMTSPRRCTTWPRTRR